MNGISWRLRKKTTTSLEYLIISLYPFNIGQDQRRPRIAPFNHKKLSTAPLFHFFSWASPPTQIRMLINFCRMSLIAADDDGPGRPKCRHLIIWCLPTNILVTSKRVRYQVGILVMPTSCVLAPGNNFVALTLRLLAIR